MVRQPAPAATAQPVTYRLGTDGRGVANATPRGPVLGKARWLDDGSLLLEFRFLEQGETGSYRLRPDGGRLAVEYEYARGSVPVYGRSGGLTFTRPTR